MRNFLSTTLILGCTTLAWGIPSQMTYQGSLKESGVPVTGLNLVLTVLTALTTVVAMRMVGVLLVSAMIVIPALTGFALGRSFRKATAIAILIALASVVLSHGAVAYFDGRFREARDA